MIRIEEVNKNIDPLKELKDFFGKSNKTIGLKEISELEKMEQETEKTGRMTGQEPYFYD